MMSKFDKLFWAGMFVALIALAIMANTRCPEWLSAALFG
ncbi:hypothetical protein LMG24076_01544 [Trinickia soli]|nr:hypothetical protein LMG24076_01544 [Trinickia soli]